VIVLGCELLWRYEVPDLPSELIGSELNNMKVKTDL
jgi:hypothetical protein